jgi:hypothetical protein
MTTNLKYFQLLQQIEKNPLRPKVARAVDILSDFKLEMERVAVNRNFSPEGRRNEAQKTLRRALRDLRDTRKTALDEYHSKTETLRASKKLAAYDKPDSLDRWKLRDRSLTMTFGQKAMRMTGPHRDKAFRDAVLEFAPWVSGFDEFEPNELKLYQEAKEEQDRELNGPLSDTITAREAVESEALMILDVVRGDIAAGLEPREFEAEVKHVESGINAHWLKREKDFSGVERTYVLVPDGDGFRGEIASPDQVRDGHFFKSHEEYLAARAA